MDNFGFGAVYFFVGSYILIALDITLNNIGFLFSMMVLTSLGTYCGVRWILAKRKMELVNRQGSSTPI